MAANGANRDVPPADEDFMRRALRLAERGYGCTSPNPMVGAVLVRSGKIIGEGWHKRAGEAHAEVNAIRQAKKRGISTSNATLYVTLEPCSTHGRTPPCTEAILGAGIKRVVVAATDPNPNHAGGGYRSLKRNGVEIEHGILARESERLNEPFHHWIVHKTPFVTVKAAMTLDGKIATRSGESKWITSEQARRFSMHLRKGSDAILVGVNTIIADDPALTLRRVGRKVIPAGKRLGRFVIDPEGRTPVSARVVTESPELTTIVVAVDRKSKVSQIEQSGVTILQAPRFGTRIDLRWLMERLGEDNITSLLVEGGGETNAAFFEAGVAHRVRFFYAPKILGGRSARKAVGGEGFTIPDQAPRLRESKWKRLGPDLLLTARVEND